MAGASGPGYVGGRSPWTARTPRGVGISGACKLYPLDELPAKVVGDKIVIEKSVLDGWTVQPVDRPVG